MAHTSTPEAAMGEGPDNLRQARLRRGWSQEQTIVRFESIARVLAVEVPARSSLRTLLSMFENNRRAVPGQYRPVFRELYRATDDELGISPSAARASLPVPPAAHAVAGGGCQAYPA
jgi:transcriptional regulator with XRE-family HTH domain